jgi:ssDNA-binding replication factor A large subunit
MQISDLKVGDKRVDVEGAIVWVDPKGLQTYTSKDGSEGQRIRVGIKDDSASTFITLFGDAAKLKLKTGKKLRIANGYVKEYNGKPQLNVGKFGTVEVV